MNPAERQKGVVVEGELVSDPGSAATDRFALARRAVAAIGTTLDDRGTAAELAAFLVEELCDSATVDLYGPQEGRREAGESLHSAAVAGRRDLLDSLEKAPRDRVSVRALDAGHPITASSSHGGAALVTLSVPLLAWDRVYGVALALRADRPFDDDETAAVHYAARLAAAHMRHSEEQREAGPRVWDLRKVLPADPERTHPEVELAVRHVPCGTGGRVGGDWCETLHLHSGRVLLVVGEVMGHGLDAAVDMNAYRSTLRCVASTDLAPHGILRRLDAMMSAESGRRPATCLLALLDPADGTAQLASAGHLPPVVFRADGTAGPVPLRVGPPIGTGPGSGLAAHEATRLPLAQDDTLVAFTYGLIARRGEDIDTSLARLSGLRTGPGAGAGELLDGILGEFLCAPAPDAARTDDDITVLATRLHPRP
ncbi:PP2C family protein-serine/threonine phosphatase [Streptomyces sp. CB01373]|uniref:PP2C family protein-serine/threonine phosphatase n=1 Tax=Streptomyces sp. CB01373 TaxID=2020325 RepID=UPI0018FEE0E6|nr:PP2C family protein-serine/threonine phosphatase [Streptomyces sp. CB01373]